MATRLWLLIIWLLPFAAFSKDDPIVLLINSYHPQYQWTQQITQGIKDVLITSIPAESLHIEYMDQRRFVDDHVFHNKLIDLLKHKYQKYEPDIIMTSDDHAFYFLIEHGEKLFPGKPIVFSGVNIIRPEELKGRENIVGIYEGMEIEENLELILQAQPNTKQIIILGDNTGLGLRMVEEAKQIKSRWDSNPKKRQVSLDIWNRFTIDELMQKIDQIEPDTVILLLAIHKDRLGAYFSYEHHLPILTRRSKVPVYGMWGTLIIDNGGLGGLMNNPYELGHSAAEIAVKILEGVPINNLDVLTKAKYSPVFNYHQLKRFGIDLDRLPTDSTVINRPTSLYEQHRGLINSSIALVIFLLIVISVLVVNIKRRIVAQENLRLFNQKLESIVEQRTKDLDERNKELQAASIKLQSLAYTDVLTGLPNRRAAANKLQAYIHRYNMVYHPLAIAILDIDLFKQINDTYGHPVGDEVLCAVGQALKTALRPGDRVYRWGGEEFLLVFPETTAEFSSDVCQRLVESIRQLRISGVSTVTASIGVTNFIKGDSLESLLLRADEALYTAKKNGRDQVVEG